MPTANGPCRFGQYCHLVRRTKLDEQGYDDVPHHDDHLQRRLPVHRRATRNDLVRTAWRAVVAQDILMKLLLKTRPYEIEKGRTDEVYQEGLEDVAAALRHEGVTHKERLANMVAALTRSRDRFRAVPATLRSLPAAHRRRRRDLLPPQHLLQHRPCPRGRGARRGVLAEPTSASGSGTPTTSSGGASSRSGRRFTRTGWCAASRPVMQHATSRRC